MEIEMRRILRRRPSPALVVAMIAVVLALTGTAVAITRTGVTKIVKKYATREASAQTFSALIGAPSGSVENAATTHITAPRKGGFLFITAGSDIFGSASDFLTCRIAVDGTSQGPTTRSIDLGQDNEDNCATNGAVRVSKGSHTVNLQATDRASTTVFDATSLDVLWVPLKG
jgi:hypothetical protein